MNDLQTKEKAMRDASLYTQSELKKDAEIRAIEQMTAELEQAMYAMKRSKDSELAQIMESHKQSIEVISFIDVVGIDIFQFLKNAHEQEIERLREGVNIKESKNLNLFNERVQALEEQLLQSIQEKNTIESNLEQQQEECRKLKVQLSKFEHDNNVRMSQVHFSIERVSVDFNNVKAFMNSSGVIQEVEAPQRNEFVSEIGCNVF